MLAGIRRRGITKKNAPQYTGFPPPLQVPTLMKKKDTCKYFRIDVLFCLFFKKNKCYT